LVQTIRPGEGGNRAQLRSQSFGADPVADQMTTLDAVFDLLRYLQIKNYFLSFLEYLEFSLSFSSISNMFAENIIQATLEQVKTTRGLSEKKRLNSIRSSLLFFFAEYSYVYNNITNTNTTKVKFNTRFVAGTNYLGLITFCCAFGITIGTMGKRGEPMLHFFLILNEIVMKLIKLVMWYVNKCKNFLKK